MTTSIQLTSIRVAFVGGGNMANAILGGLVQQGLAASSICVVEPVQAVREQLAQQWGVQAAANAAQASTQLQQAQLVVWAVKPQVFQAAAAPVAPWVAQALHLSVAAGIPTASLTQWLNTPRVVRAMPNTPALIGQGMTGLFANPAVNSEDRQLAEQVMHSVGQTVWLQDEAHMDAVTALSGSGPAYVFYVLEAMIQAGTQMGLSATQARQLAIQTFKGASALAEGSPDTPEVLRQRVTSKGGTTHAAISSLEADQVGALFIKALHAARDRGEEMGKEFGA
ncbi:MAG: pyrroline-5-carboxylate reductase [Betaproteobacteria bacterium]|nr:pyrroline-5-carboxylate reductase [Betaproteobacteria bacterium]